MSNEIHPNLVLPEKPFLTEAEIEEQLQELTVGLKDSKGTAHNITMPICMWHWFLILTWDGHKPQSFLDNVIASRDDIEPEQDLSIVFSECLTELVRLSDPRLDDPCYTDANYYRFMDYKESNTHPYYDELVDLQPLFDHKVKYPVMPPFFPKRSKFFYEDE